MGVGEGERSEVVVGRASGAKRSGASKGKECENVMDTWTQLLWNKYTPLPAGNAVAGGGQGPFRHLWVKSLCVCAPDGEREFSGNGAFGGGRGAEWDVLWANTAAVATAAEHACAACATPRPPIRPRFPRTRI